MPITLTEVRHLLADHELTEKEIGQIARRLHTEHKTEILFTEVMQEPGDPSTRRTRLTVSIVCPWEVKL